MNKIIGLSLVIVFLFACKSENKKVQIRPKKTQPYKQLLGTNRMVELTNLMTKIF